MEEQIDSGANELMEIEDQWDAELRAEYRQRQERRLPEAQRLKKNGASRCT